MIMDTMEGVDLMGEIKRLSNEIGLLLAEDDVKEYEEIRILGDIVREIQSPDIIYYTDT